MVAGDRAKQRLGLGCGCRQIAEEISHFIEDRVIGLSDRQVFKILQKVEKS